MMVLSLNNKNRSRFSKGSSEFTVTVLITQADCDSFPNLPRSWIGKEITRNIFQWDELLPITSDTLRGRIRQEAKDIHANNPKRIPRGSRSILGLDEFITRTNQKGGMKKKKVVNVQVVANNWLQGRM